MAAQLSVGQLLDEGRDVLSEVSSSAGLDTRILLQSILGKDEAWLMAHSRTPVDDKDLRRLRALLKRRAKGEPVAYLVGEKEFWNLTLKVSPGVLIPRPETELLVEKALGRIPASEPLDIADLGTGSGAIGLSIARERPLCRVIATDCSEAALRIAEMNKGRAGVRNIRYRRGHWYHPLQDRRYAVIVSNPPYVQSSHYEIALSYEPPEALFSGSLGLDALAEVVVGARRHLNAGGWLLVEHGFDQQDAVEALFLRAGFTEVRCFRDYADLPRVTEGRSP